MAVLNWCDEADDVCNKLTNAKSVAVDYVLFCVTNPKKSKPSMELEASGKGGRATVAEILSSGSCDDKVITGAFLASAVDERGSVISVRPKYIHVTFVGAGVGVLTKGKVNGWSGNFRDRFPGCAIYLQLIGGDLDDIQEDTLEKNLIAAGGAHKPSRYDFTNGTLRGSLGLQDDDDTTAKREAEEARIKAEGEAARKKRDARKKEEAVAKKAAEEEAKRNRLEDETRRKEAEEDAKKKKAAEEERRKEEARQKAEAEKSNLKKIEAVPKSPRKPEPKMTANLKKVEAVPKSPQKSEPMIAPKLKKVEAVPKSPLKSEPMIAAKLKKVKIPPGSPRKSESKVVAAPKLRSVSIEKKGEAEQTELKTKDDDFIMLLSSQSGSADQAKHIRNSQDILKSIGVVPAVVDGSDPAQKQTREQLFRLSGIRGNYPQFFTKEKERDMDFFGDYDTFERKNEDGSLAKELSKLVAIGESTPMNSPAPKKKKLILMVSNMCAPQVKADQDHLKAVVEGLGIKDLELLDGADAQNKEKRNQLWGISGVRAKYPQLFAVDTDGTTKFVGDHETVSDLHDQGALAEELGLN